MNGNLTLIICTCYSKSFKKGDPSLKGLEDTHISLGMASFSTVSSGLTDAMVTGNIQWAINDHHRCDCH